MRILILSLLLATATFAQTDTPKAPAPKAPACDGNMATVRISAIPATGTMEGFMKAVAAHAEWYRSHGMADHQIFAAPIWIRDEKTREQVVSTKEIMTFHVLPVTRSPETPHDAGYDAFTKLYRENSEITKQYNVCMPKTK